MSVPYNIESLVTSCDMFHCVLAASATTAPPALATTPIPDCAGDPMISGTHYLPDYAIAVSSSYNADHGPQNSRLDWKKGSE